MALQSWDKDNNKEWKVASDWIKNNTILLPFVPKPYEDDDHYGDGPEVEHRGMQAISPKDKKKAFDKFVIDWRKQNGLEGTKVMPPKDVIPFWIRAKGERDDMTIAHGGQHYDEHGRPIKDPAWGITPGGDLIYMEHMEQSPEEHKRNEDLHIKKYGKQAQVDYGVPTPRDLFLQRFQGKGGTLRDHPAKIRPTILSIAERMKA